MKKTPLILISFFLLTSFLVKQNEVVGRWRWAYVFNKKTYENIPVSHIMMNRYDDVEMEFNADGTFLEYKNKAGKLDKKPALGNWKLNNNGDVLQMKNANAQSQNQSWLKQKIIRFTGDTLVLDSKDPFQIVMAREKKVK